MTKTNHLWKSRWTFIMAATGSAVGLGNIWKFPYITGEYGGGAFVLVYLACILLVGIPVMMSEVMLGRAGRSDPIDSMLKLSRQSAASPGWSLVGISGVLAGMMILAFYSVVAGWALEYVWQSASGHYNGVEASAIENHFGELTSDISRQLIWHTVFIALTAGVVAAGVSKGIGAAVDTLMPTLFILMIILVAYAIFEGDFAAGAAFLFTPDFSKLSGETILVALGHAFFTLSLGMGAIMVYGSYMPSGGNIGTTVLLIAFFDTAIALLAGLAIFPIVFSNGLQPGAGPGLMFVTLPLAFNSLPAGNLMGTIFFALVSIAALSSSISLIEPGVAWLEKHRIPRLASTLALALTGWAGGALCIHYGSVFDFLDYVTANIMLPLGGLLIAIFTGWILSPDRVKNEIGFKSFRMHKIWLWIIRVVAPAGIVLIFANSLGLI